MCVCMDPESVTQPSIDFYLATKYKRTFVAVNTVVERHFVIKNK